MAKSKKIKLFIGLFYIILVSLFLYFIFTKFSFQEITSYEFIKINRDYFYNLRESNLILLTKGDGLKVKALNKTKFHLISGKPIGEPIARGGPFVMNTKAEIIEAINDYQNGTFAKY